MDNLNELIEKLGPEFRDSLKQQAESLMAEQKQKEALIDMFNEATKHRPVFRHKDTAYTIDNGCKIEKHSDGTIKIYNTRTGGDFYEHLPPSYYELFAREGFDVGSIQLSIDTLSVMLSKMQSRTEKKFEVEKENLKEKINDYKNKIAFYKKRNS